MPHRVFKSHRTQTSRGHPQILLTLWKNAVPIINENATIDARELTHELQDPTPASPFSNIGDKQIEALHQLTELFQQAVTKNNNTPKSVAPPTITQT